VVSGCYEERHELHEFFNRKDAKDAEKTEDQGSGINHVKHERPAAAKKHKESLTRITPISTDFLNRQDAKNAENTGRPGFRD